MGLGRKGSYFTDRSYHDPTSPTLNEKSIDQHQHQAGFPTYFLAAALSLHAVMREVKLKIAYIFPESRQRLFASAALVHELENHRITFLGTHPNQLTHSRLMAIEGYAYRQSLNRSIKAIATYRMYGVFGTCQAFEQITTKDASYKIIVGAFP